MITPEQKEFRKGKIGSSDCAAALGVSPWCSRAGLFHIIKGNITPPDIGPRGRIGNAIEPIIAGEYEIEEEKRLVSPSANDFKHCKVKEFPGAESPTFIHPDYDFLICHFDRKIQGEYKLVEMKNVGPTMFYKWGMDGDPNGVPMDVNFQCIYQAMIADVERVDVAAFFGGNELRVYPLNITEKAKKGVLDGLIAFWEEFVVPNKQPEVTEKDIDLIKQLYWDTFNEKIVEVESTATAIAFQDYRDLKGQIAGLEKKRDLYKAKIIEFMGDAGICMRGEDIEFTHKKTKDSEVIDYPGVLDDIVSISDTRGLLNMDPCEMIYFIQKGNTSIKPGHRMFLDKGK